MTENLSVRVRLTRVGSNKNPIWRIVVADQRSPRDGRFIEMLGHYNPQTEPSEIALDRDRLDHWLARGAQPSNTVRKLMRVPNTAPKAAPEPEPEAAAAPEAPAEPAEAAETPEPAGDPESAPPAQARPEAEAAPPEAAPAAPGEPAPEAEAPAG